MYYVAFVPDLSVPFNPAVHLREDLEVYNLRISQNEGEVARCEIEIVNPGVLNLFSLDMKNVIISTDETGTPEIMFRGSLIAIPTELTGEYCTIEFLAEKRTTREEKKAIALSEREAGFFDDLFVNPDDEDSVIASVTQNSARSWYVDRKTLAVKLSDDLSGDRIFNIGTEFFNDTLRISTGDLPVAKAKLRVSVEWEQAAKGQVNIEMGEIFTCTPQNFEQNYPGLGGQLENATGWQILPSKIKGKGKSRSLIDFTRQTILGRAVNREITVEAFRYEDTDIKARYDYRQPRKETLDIEMDSSYQPIFGDIDREESLEEQNLGDVLQDRLTDAWEPQKPYVVDDIVQAQGKRWRCVLDHTSGVEFLNFTPRVIGNGKILEINLFWVPVQSLSPLGDSRRSSYFQTDNGKRTIKVAVERVRAFILRRMRFLTISLEAPYELLRDIDTDSNLRIVTDKIPGGAAIGKVTSYTIEVNDAGERFVSVEMKVSIGTGQNLSSPIVGQSAVFADSYALEDYVETVGQTEMTESGVTFSTIMRKPVRTPVNPFLLSSSPYAVVENSVENSSADQRSEIRNIVGSKPFNASQQISTEISEYLDNFPTRINLRLRSLASEDLLEAIFKIECQKIVVPRGINLDGDIPV